MKNLQSGQNIVLNESVVEININCRLPGADGDATDVSAYMLGSNNKVRSDGDFIFYNQPSSQEGAVTLQSNDNTQCYTIDLKKVPDDVLKIALAIAINTDIAFELAEALSIEVKGEVIFMPNTANMTERALILGQVYRHNNTWKFRALGTGFKGGLSPLAMSFGVDVASDEPETTSKTTTINLEKIIEQKAPRLINLAKPAKISLEKKNLTNTRARVALVLDCSGSMGNQFRHGNVQGVLDRLAVLAVQFDDDAAFDLWAFAEEFNKYEDVSLDNIDGYIERLTAKETSGFLGRLKSSMGGIVKGLGFGNNEPPVMEDVIKYYKDSDLPAYILFITDGGIYKSSQIKKLMSQAARYPIFWKFLGLGGSGYGILEELDDLTGRVVDNADFFPIDDFKTVPDDLLYDRLLNEFPEWLSAAKAANILKS